jgi:small subunit ribosomal protein S1
MESNLSSSLAAADLPNGERKTFFGGGRAKHPMEILLKRAGIAAVKTGDVLDGKILEKRGARIFIDLGAQGMGIVYGREYMAAQDILKALSLGDTVSVKVVESDNEEGYVELSLREAGEEKRWSELKRIMREGNILELPVIEANRGGLMLETKGVKGFLPASQLSSKHYPRVDGGDKEKIYQELQKLVGEVMRVKIIDVIPSEQKLIFSEKSSYGQDRKTILSRYRPGEEVDGEITSVVDFGAFVRLDGTDIEGLIHISELDWSLVEHPRSLLKAGDRVRAKILDISGEKISLSLKRLKEDPWKKAAERYKKGDVVKAKIVRFAPFGAFAEVEKDIHGLLHVSAFGTEEAMKKSLTLNQEYDVAILSIDPGEHRLSLGTAASSAAPATEPQTP